ncbi:MAG: hypothetical protein LBV29_04040 [Azoarcus sp.]|nr:hypothetical protein [Azoarcus sp.]
MNDKFPRWVSITFCAFLALLPGQVLAQTCPAPPGWLDGLTNPGADDGADGGEAESCDGMMRARIQSPVVSLALSDRPLLYRPAKGPQVPLSFYYSQREMHQPETFHYANLGPKWTYSGLSYIIDDPKRPGEEVERYKSGGGTRKFNKEDFDPKTGRFAPDGRDGSVLVRVAGTSLKYERHSANGMIETYAHSDRKTEHPRRFFLSERRDPAGNRIVFEYDGQNRLLSVLDATGKRTMLEYGHKEDPLKITGIKDPYGRRAQIGYDARGRLTSITDAVGLVSRVTYPGKSTFIDTLTTPYGVSRFASGNSWEAVQWVEITDPLGRTERVESRDDAPGIVDTEKDAPAVAGIVNKGLSKNNTFHWDALAYEKRKHKIDYTQAKILHWRSDEAGKTADVLSSVKQPLESRQWYVYGSKAKTTGLSSRPTGIARVLPDGQTQLRQFAWNEKGHPLMKRDPLGRETKITYAPNGIDVIKEQQKTATGYDTLSEITWNKQHLPLTVRDATGKITTYTYNSAGQPLQVSGKLGASVRYHYDEQGRLTRMINPTGRVRESYTYDAFGNIASQTDSEGATTKHEYDALNRLTKTTYPDGTTLENTWDKLDIVRVKDRSGKLTHTQYDAARQLVEYRDALRAIQFGYDKAGRLVSLTDGGGQQTRWQRDIQGRVIGKYSADDTRLFYSYDSAGRLAKHTDKRGQEQHFSYDKSDNLTRSSYQYTQVPTPGVSLAWDAHYPRIVAMRDGTGETRYRYGAVGKAGANQLVSVEDPSNIPLKLRYGASNRVEGWRLGASGEDYTFDVLGRLVTNQNSALGQFDYDYLGETQQLTSALLRNTPLKHTYAYETASGDHHLQEIRHPQGARSYAYQTTNDLIMSLTETLPGQSRTWHYQYDGINRLQTASRNDGRAYRYSLDKGDNLVSILSPEGERTYPVGLGNRIRKDNYQHDQAGNRISDERHTYQWDAENRLVRIGYRNDSSKSTQFKYDGLARRVAIIETEGTQRTETRYTWCGDKICQARDEKNRPIATYFGNGTHRPQEKANKKEYYARDHLGSIRDVLDEKGKVIARYDYEPYGKLIDGSNKPPEFGYAGMQYHAPSGLYLTHYRAYDPETGRWLSRDPIEERGGINLYAYVNGNPVSFVDPTGEIAIVFVYAGVAALSVAIIADYYGVQQSQVKINGTKVEISDYDAITKNKDTLGNRSMGARPGSEPGTCEMIWMAVLNALGQQQLANAGGDEGSDEVPPAVTSPGEAPPVDKNDPDALSAAHLATNGDKTKPGYGGNCTPNQYDRLSQEQFDVCKSPTGAQTIGGCRGLRSDQLAEIADRLSKWEQCKNARKNVADQCFAGGDDGHNTQISNAQIVIDKCRDMLR